MLLREKLRVSKFGTMSRMAKRIDGAELVNKLNANDGVVHIEAPSGATRRRYRQLLYAATTGGHVPTGKKITYTGRDNGPLTIRLVDNVAVAPKPDKLAVKVPTRVNRYHPSLAATITALKTAKKDERGRAYLRGYGVVSLDVSRAHHTRALRLLHALYTAAEQHGYEIRKGQRSRNGYADTGHIGIFICSTEGRWEIRIVEKCDSVPHIPTIKETEDHRRYSWNRIPDHDYVPNGQLEIRIEGYDHGHRSRFGDGTRFQLEDKLGDVITALNARVAENKTARERSLELDRLYEQARRPAIERARQAFIDDKLREHLGKQLEAANLCRQMRQLASDIEATHPTNVEWVDWIRQEADRQDPIQNSDTMPHVEPPAEYQLGAYTRNWPETRPYGWSL